MKCNLKNVVCSILFFSIFSNFLNSTIKDAEHVFDRLYNMQLLVDDIALTEMKKYLSEINISIVQNQFQANLDFFKSFTSFFELPINDYVQDAFLKSSLSNNQALLQRFLQIYDLMENDFSAFVKILSESSFAKGAINSEEDKIFVNILLSKYWGLINPLFMYKDEYKNAKFLMSLGNRFFEYCFNDKTFVEYKNIFINKDLSPVIKFLHTGIWQTLVGFGWKYWHKDCLDKLKQSADKGSEIVYIAGGCDIYHFIKKGIYNIRIIDPFLPTQIRYYSSGWSWFANLDLLNDDASKIGDEIHFNFSDKKIILRRSSYKRTGEMCLRLSNGKVAFFPENETIWDVVDAKSNKKVGRIIIERRETVQDDFIKDDKKVLVMSCTEMISAIDTQEQNGWGIDAHQLQDDLQVYVKQLRNPVAGKMLKNIRFACEKQLDLSYITLASDPR